jgi:hypothetical protein
VPANAPRKLTPEAITEYETDHGRDVIRHDAFEHSRPQFGRAAIVRIPVAGRVALDEPPAARGRPGRFWEQRYHSTAFRTGGTRRALQTLRYVHANPKAAGINSGFGYRYSNYHTYEKLSDDGLTDWHPAFLRLWRSLAECAARYRAFCRGHRIKTK